MTAMIENGAVVIAFSKSSVEPLLYNPDINLDRVKANTLFHEMASFIH